MTALAWAGMAAGYVLLAVIFARRLYATYPWDYEDMAWHGFLSLALGLIWPLAVLVVAVFWRNPTASQRESALREREDKVRRMERELGL